MLEIREAVELGEFWASCLTAKIILGSLDIFKKNLIFQ